MRKGLWEEGQVQTEDAELSLGRVEFEMLTGQNENNDSVVTSVSYSYCGDHFPTHINIQSCGTPETNVTLYVNYTPVNAKVNQEISFLCSHAFSKCLSLGSCLLGAPNHAWFGTVQFGLPFAQINSKFFSMPQFIF